MNAIAPTRMKSDRPRKPFRLAEVSRTAFSSCVRRTLTCFGADALVGGLHKMMAWDGPILTDSGGYQVFSLSALRKITDEEVVFQSHIDGATVELTSEACMDVQAKLGADIVMQLDECPPADYCCDVFLAQRVKNNCPAGIFSTIPHLCCRNVLALRHGI